MAERNEGRARRLTPEQRRRILERRRRKRMRKRLMIAGCALALVLVVALVGTLAFGKRNRASDAPDVPVSGEVSSETFAELPGEEPTDASEAPEGEALPDEASSGEEPTGEASTGDAPASNAAPAQYGTGGGTFVFDEAYAAAARGEVTGAPIVPDYSAIDPSKLERWAKPNDGYIPVLYSAKNVTENVISITVDDCYQPDNLRQIVQCALDNGGRLTIFPIGENVARKKIGEAVKWAWESGMEIENHSYKHLGTYHFEDENMIRDIWAQSDALNQALGVNYKQHFFRPKGGDEYKDQRTHAYVRQLGMYGISLWGYSGSGNNLANLTNSLQPGRVYLFHTTDRDTAKLMQFIPYAISQGYRLVTLNEMFGLPENETSDLSTAAKEPPPLESFQIAPAELRKTSYMRAAAVVQKRLIELGYLDGEADGVFGNSSYMATGYFQLAAGLKADGVAGLKTQAAMFAEDAPRKQ